MSRTNRIQRELDMLLKDPPEGISICTYPDENNRLEARITGPSGSAFEGGVFTVEIKLPERYPFEAPLLRFQTKLYHPNVDETGRICLDSLKLPPAGSWRPSLNLLQVLSQLRILLVEPGLGDPLMKDIADVYKNDYERYVATARDWTSKFAQGIQSPNKRVRQENES